MIVRSPTDFQYATPAAPAYPGVTNSNLTFGGVPEIGNLNSANLGYGPSVPKSTFSTYDRSPGLFSNLLSGLGFDMGTPAASGNAPTRPQARPQINTAAVDGTTGFISALQGQLGAILGNIGSSGDSPEAQMQAAGWGPEPEPQGLSMPVILAVLAVGGVIYYASKG